MQLVNKVLITVFLALQTEILNQFVIVLLDTSKILVILVNNVIMNVSLVIILISVQIVLQIQEYFLLLLQIVIVKKEHMMSELIFAKHVIITV